MLRWLPLLFLAACAGQAQGQEPETALAPLPIVDIPPPEPMRWLVGVKTAEPAEMEAIAAGLDLWSAASGGSFRTELVMVDDCTRAGTDWCVQVLPEITDCDDPSTNNVRRVPGGPRACSWEHEGLPFIQLSRTALEPGEWAGSVAHETGHRLGLAHLPGTGDLMDPDRPENIRLAPCISSDDVAAAGFEGPGACL